MGKLWGGAGAVGKLGGGGALMFGSGETDPGGGGKLGIEIGPPDGGRVAGGGTRGVLKIVGEVPVGPAP